MLIFASLKHNTIYNTVNENKCICFKTYRAQSC